MADEWIRQAEVAFRLDLTPRQIRNLEREGLPTNGRARLEKRYPWPEARTWYLEDWKKRERVHGGPHRIRKLKAEAELAELEARKARGELLTRSDALGLLDRLETFLASVRAELEAD